MERYKENLKWRQDQNIASSVLMICFLILTLSFLGAFSLVADDREMAADEENRVVASQDR